LRHKGLKEGKKKKSEIKKDHALNCHGYSYAAAFV